MIKRLVWMSSGYVAGAASGWYVSRRVKRAAERVLPTAVRNEVTARIGQLGRRAAPLPEHGRELLHRVRAVDLDLTDRVRLPERARSRA